MLVDSLDSFKKELTYVGKIVDVEPGETTEEAIRRSFFVADHTGGIWGGNYSYIVLEIKEIGSVEVKAEITVEAEVRLS